MYKAHIKSNSFPIGFNLEMADNGESLEFIIDKSQTHTKTNINGQEIVFEKKGLIKLNLNISKNTETETNIKTLQEADKSKINSMIITNRKTGESRTLGQGIIEKIKESNGTAIYQLFFENK